MACAALTRMRFSFTAQSETSHEWET
jgi:hypothetical protein